MAVIGTSALQYSGGERLAYALSCIGVSWAWSAGLAVVGYLMGVVASRVNLRRWLNRASAVVMWGVALKLLVSLSA